VTSFNPEAERILGLGNDEAVGRHVDEVIPLARELVLEGAGANLATNNTRSRLAHRNAHGEDLFLGLAASILKDLDGSPSGHIIIFQDVTGVVAMERQLRQSERMAALGEMSAKIAHEVRNPLAAISGSIQVLRTQQAHPSPGDQRPSRSSARSARSTSARPASSRAGRCRPACR